MRRAELEALIGPRGYPAVSILTPTHRHPPENTQDPIRVRNLVREALDRAGTQLDAQALAELRGQLDAAVAEVDFERTVAGLAMFATRFEHHVRHLPFPVEPRAVVNASYAVRDLVLASNRTPRYLVLVLSERPSRLFEAHADHLVERTDHGFPLVHDGPGGAAPLPGGFGIRRSAHRDERHRQFFRGVDQALGAVLAADPLPVVLVGVDRHRAFFAEVTDHADAIVAHVDGSHDATPVPRLTELVWPAVQEHFAARRAALVDALDEAEGARRLATGLTEVFALARQGRGARLVVEEDYRVPARIDGDQVVVEDDGAPGDGPDRVDDAVDEIVEAVLTTGGEVTFAEPGALAARGRIALVLRF